MIMNIIMPDEGRDQPVRQPRRRAGTCRDRIGYLPEERGSLPEDEGARPAGLPGRDQGHLRARAAADQGEPVARAAGPADWAQRKVQDLSKGMQQKVQFIGALLHDPELVILDEPFSGLDPVNSQVMKEVVVEIGPAGTDRALLDPHHGTGRADVRPDRDHRPGREGAWMARWRRSSRSSAGGTSR